ncbi:MAG: hypothetical protein J6O13_15440 [Selenomonas sp.]|nr:hypothetical protein [Selenomonas sp.]
MSAFKEMVTEDMDDVFLNPEEFADEHDLNGTLCNCIVESPTSKESLQVGRDYEGYDAVHSIVVTIHVKKADIGEMPVEDQLFSLDEEEFLVDSCVEHMGMLTINLKANISGLDGAGGW